MILRAVLAIAALSLAAVEGRAATVPASIPAAVSPDTWVQVGTPTPRWIPWVELITDPTIAIPRQLDPKTPSQSLADEPYVHDSLLQPPKM